MLQIDGVPPKLASRHCEELWCQQYWHQGKLVQDVDALLLKVNGRWHQLYFDEGIVFWRLAQMAPEQVTPDADDPFVYPLIDLGQKFAVKDAYVTDCLTEPLIGGARVSIIFENKGTLVITHSDNQTRLQFIRH